MLHLEGLGKSGTGTGTGTEIFRAKARRGPGSRFLGKGTGKGFLSKGGTRLYGFKGRNRNKVGKRISYAYSCLHVLYIFMKLRIAYS